MEYKQGQKVLYDVQGLQGTGKIVGVATIGAAIIGKTYIIEPDKSIANPTYDYSHFVCFELFLKPLDSNSSDAEKAKESLMELLRAFEANDGIRFPLANVVVSNDGHGGEHLIVNLYYNKHVDSIPKSVNGFIVTPKIISLGTYQG